jgi:tannase/feruloyl esterase
LPVPARRILRAQSGGGPSEAVCASLARAADLPNHTTRIQAATLTTAAEARQPTGPFAAPTPTLPEHCHVLGRIAERAGANDQRYAIAFRLRLPTKWNGRFFFEGGGGRLGGAFGRCRGSNRLLRWRSVMRSRRRIPGTTTGRTTIRGGTQTFGFDPQARIDFGYNSYDQVATVSKAIIARYYGRPADKSYFAGCSEGGRGGMMLSQRYPARFDV